MFTINAIDRDHVADALHATFGDGIELDELLERFDAYIDKRVSYGDADFTLLETTQIPLLAEHGIAQPELYYAVYG